MEICYHDYLFSISIFGYVFVSTCCAESLYRKTSVGETHYDAKTKFDREIHELWKVINQGPRTTKWAPSSCNTLGIWLTYLHLHFIRMNIIHLIYAFVLLAT
jgi:hypothetical protein